MSVHGPPGELQGELPSTDSGEQVDSFVVREIVTASFLDSLLKHVTAESAGTHKVTQPRADLRVAVGVEGHASAGRFAVGRATRRELALLRIVSFFTRYSPLWGATTKSSTSTSLSFESKNWTGP